MRLKLPLHLYFRAESQRKAFEDIGTKLRVRTLEDWYKIDRATIRRSGRRGNALMQRHPGTSLSKALRIVYPWFNWDLRHFKERPQGYWTSSSVQRAVVDKIGLDCRVKVLDDWYQLDLAKVKRRGGKQVLQRHGNDLLKALAFVYPDHKWVRWRLKDVGAKDTHGYWTKTKQRQRFDDIAELLDLKDASAWYNVKYSDIIHLAGFLAKHYGSVAFACKALYPDYNWQLSKFGAAPKGHWDDINNRLLKMDEIAKNLSVRQLDDWYKVERCLVRPDSTTMLSKFYGGSIMTAVESLYPHHPWKKRPKKWQSGHWTNVDTQIAFLTVVAKKLGIISLGDWYRVSHQQLAALGGAGICTYFPRVLQSIEPCFDWDWSLFSTFGSKKAKQRMLSKRIAHIFQGCQVVEEHKVCLRHLSGNALVVDVFVAEFHLALEYQGEQHYQDMIQFSVPTTAMQYRDAEKLQQCLDTGIELVPIPYWWCGEVSALIATIRNFVEDPRLQSYLTTRAKNLGLDGLPVEHFAIERSMTNLMAPGQLQMAL